MIGRKRRIGPGAAVGVVLLGAILVGMADEWEKEAENVFGDFTIRKSEVVSGKVRVVDADTLDVGGTRVRLRGIDGVEKDQMCQDNAGTNWPCGQLAFEDLDIAFAGEDMRCFVQDTDRYGRAVADCEIAGISVNYWVVRHGWAVAYTRYSRDFEAVEAEARADQSGIFAGTFTPPQEWRFQQR